MTNRTEDDARKYVVKRIKDGTLRAVNFFKWLESSSAEKKVAQTRLSNILLKIVNEEIRIKCPNLEEALTLAKAIRQQLEDDSFKYYWLQKRQDEEGQVRAGNWWVPARKRFEEYAAAAQPPRTTQKPPSSPEPVPDSQDLQLQKRKRSPSTPDLEDDGNAADVQNHLVDLREAVEFSEETLLGQCGSNTWMIEHVSGLINFTKAMDPFLQQKGRHLLKLWRDAAMVGADQMRGSSTDELTEYPITKIKNWSGEEYGAIVMGLVALQETGKLGDAEPSFRHIVGKVMGTVKTSRAYEPSGIEFQSLCGCLKRLSKLDVSRPVQDEQDVRFVWAALIGECLPARCQTEISLEYRHNFSDAAVTKSDITMFVLHRAFSIGYAVIEVQPGEDEPHKDHHKAPVELYEQITKFLHATALFCRHIPVYVPTSSDDVFL
ncbi:hypothetical protein DFS34DRAFT_653527 [Phlyctochytrium arcticum]|nr:hypothetical protein DFS34DRAFT_653527 [Phlyctochytrium arcticum]